MKSKSTRIKVVGSETNPLIPMGSRAAGRGEKWERNERKMREK